MAAPARSRSATRRPVLAAHRALARSQVDGREGEAVDASLVRDQPHGLPARVARFARRAGGCEMTASAARTRIMRTQEWSHPVQSVNREIRTALPADDEG